MRRFPILIRLALVIALISASLIIGLMVGYGVIGDGDPQDVLKKETWTHILDLVMKDAK
ncbi:DNA-directed RNA polymerase subunit beta [Jeotgalibacillus marinus]|uniref:DNA-directed RNA polymerase subunit beta n=1 Tax=Jeotgalibacillus marinus TaxID=86667 RepID=UPI003F5C279A